MTTVLLSHRFHQASGRALVESAAGHGVTLEPIVLPAEPKQRLDADECKRIEIAYFSEDVVPDFGRQFFSACYKAQRLRWLHAFNAGVDHPVFAQMLGRGVRVTTSSGANAGPVGVTAAAGMLMLARGFPGWMAAQRRHAWEPVRGGSVPEDLSGQTLLLVGLGEIGKTMARIAQALGMRVIGVRRSSRRPDDPVDEMHPPAALDWLLPRAHWLALACPLTDQTRRMFGAARLALLPKGARIVNVARGELIDEQALIAALVGGHLGGAYLDVFEQEPLPAQSPLWDLPNVVLSPHNAAASSGNDARATAMFLRNLALDARGEAMVNEVMKGAGRE
ncbi:MAG: D-2-hydroxyacid dehydrogenase [Betaproteobacteria bacterium]|nr:D-2-hydroxyacid dehydrogenase [Betaproteobacteria bacterium]